MGSLRRLVPIAALVATTLVPASASVGAAAATTPRAAPTAAFQPAYEAFGPSDLVGATCPTSSVCLAVGRQPPPGTDTDGLPLYSLLYRSTDAGLTWTTLPEPGGEVSGYVDDTQVVSLSCGSPTFCVFEAATSEGDFPDDQFYVSHDTGLTWSPAGTIQHENLFSVGMTGLVCTGTATCVGIIDGAIASSTDGARSWGVRKPDDAVAVSCPSATSCYVIQEAASSEGRDVLGISRSSNRGGTLTTVLRLAGRWNAPPAISCSTRIDCSIATSGQSGLFDSTVDGGRTWRLEPGPTITLSERLESFTCVASEDCTALASQVASPSRTASFSTIGSAPWSYYALVGQLGYLGAVPSLSCTSARCWATLGTRSVFSIPDVDSNSATWHGSPIAGGAANLSAIACEQSGSCLAVGTGVEATSTDDGHTWTMRPDAALDGDVFDDLTCPFASTCIASGSDGSAAVPTGLVLLTTDLGETWAAGTVPWEVGYVHKVSCDPTGTACVAIPGFASALANVPTFLLQSTDGGSTWTLVTLAPASANELILGVACSSATHCLAVGATYAGTPSTSVASTALVEASDDAGATWTTITGTPTGPGFGDLSCPTPLDCTATGLPSAGSSVAITYATGDGGATWTAGGELDTQPLLGSQPAFELSCAFEVCAGLSMQLWYVQRSIPDVAIVTSSDGGGSWDSFETSYLVDFWAYYFEVPAPLQGVGVAIAPNGTVLAVGTNVEDGPLILSTSS